MKIAFLGLGRMGRALAGHLLGGEHEVTVWNRTPSAADDLVARGAVRATTAADAVAGAEVVVTMLASPEVVRAVVLDPPLPLGPGTLWIDVSTVGPADTVDFAAWAGAQGVRYGHSPVIGSVGPAVAGELRVLIGGSSDVVAAARPIVSAWAADPSAVRIYDTPGQAATAKLVVNLSLAVATQGLVEALRLGRSGGLSVDEVFAVLDGTSLAGVVAQKGAAIRSGAFGDTQFSAALMAKDTRLMTQASAGPLPAVTALFDALENARRYGHGDDDFSIVAGD